MNTNFVLSQNKNGLIRYWQPSGTWSKNGKTAKQLNAEDADYWLKYFTDQQGKLSVPVATYSLIPLRQSVDEYKFTGKKGTVGIIKEDNPMWRVVKDEQLLLLANEEYYNGEFVVKTSKGYIPTTFFKP